MREQRLTIKNRFFVSGVKKIFFMKNFTNFFFVHFRKFYRIFSLIDI
jgi:hypothetical protein